MMYLCILCKFYAKAPFRAGDLGKKGTKQAVLENVPEALSHERVDFGLASEAKKRRSRAPKASAEKICSIVCEFTRQGLFAPLGCAKCARKKRYFENAPWVTRLRTHGFARSSQTKRKCCAFF